MIYTVTFNPSLDYVVNVEDFKLGMINRTVSERMSAGGKGINVSIVLHNLGIESVALGFVAGFTGKEIEKEVKSYGCKSDFIYIEEGNSRINIKLKSNEESEINGQGPIISKNALDQLFSQLDLLKDEDILVLAGSIPNTLPADIYEKILKKLKNKKVKVVVDATKELLCNVLKYHPFLIKPNYHELGEIFGVVLNSKEQIILYARKLQELGARNILVSMDKDGAILLSEEDKVYYLKSPEGQVLDSVGAGDSMVAGFLTGYLETGNLIESLKMGIATGSASAFSIYLATKEEVTSLYKMLTDVKEFL